MIGERELFLAPIELLNVFVVPFYAAIKCDFLALNALKQHKSYFLGGFYWMLGNLHPKYRSSLKNVNLLILCPVKWIKKYGMNKILQPFMSDLALLESVSIF